MSRGINKVILVGSVGADPEIRYTTNGTAMGTASLATNDVRKGQDGQKVETTEWHRLVFIGRQAEILGEYVVKGSQLYVEGRLQTRKWRDSTGRDRYTTEIVVREFQMLGGKKAQQQQPRQQQPQQVAQYVEQQPQCASQQPHPDGPQGDNWGDFDDDIPF